MFHWIQSRLQKPDANGTPKADPNAFPRRIQIEGDTLTVTIHDHDILRFGQEIPCWTFVTDGLRSVGQQELQFILQQQVGESTYPRDILPFFQTVLRFAREKRFVTAGGFTHFGSAMFCDFPAVLYTQAAALSDIPRGAAPLSETLQMHLLHAGELDAVKLWGPTRVLARFGHAVRYYPFPEWNDRRRPPLPIRTELSQSVLSEATRLRAPGASVYREGDGVILMRASAKAANGIRTALESMTEPVPVALLTDWEPTATGALVWTSGQKEPEAILPPHGGNSRLSGSFLLIVPLRDDEEDDAAPMEDGFALMLTPPTYKRMLDSLRDGTPRTLPAGKSGHRFAFWYTV